ncbi:hypothetical protein Q8F54_10340 (plasmid) [Leuconostoc mesenteroides]|uniref:hypothetical protein n=1 Tax=Leuconostoc mesenteroides TaxID=1245 RepID=UPI002815C12A|nr:hypothetical protein [Leuconostoc mesenteroides]WMS40719.1 hypothetical protein Q8F54_10340 [Leuconostoc mesenteroides]
MPEKLAMYSIESNKINSISSIDGLNESTVLNMIENIHIQSAQLIQIRKFYDDFQEFSALNFQINTLLNEIKDNTTRQGDLQKLSRMLNHYTYSFYEFVTFAEKYAKKHDKIILFDNLMAYQYDSFYEYRVAYHLGNYGKHVSQFVPLKALDDINGYKVTISNTKVLAEYKKATTTAKNVFKEKEEVNLLDYLDTTYDCLNVQMMCFVKHILIDQKACEYFKITYPFIEKYGFPTYIDSTDPNHIQIKAFNDNVFELQIYVAKITNELDLTHFKIIEENT